MTGATVETIIHDIEKLSASDRAKLFRALAVKSLASSSGAADGKSKRLPVPEPDHEPNRRWLAAHKSEYAGKWVALDGDRLIAAGESEKEVANAAKADGAYLPLIVYIPNLDEPAFVGV